MSTLLLIESRKVVRQVGLERIDAAADRALKQLANFLSVRNKCTVRHILHIDDN